MSQSLRSILNFSGAEPFIQKYCGRELTEDQISSRAIDIFCEDIKAGEILNSWISEDISNEQLLTRLQERKERALDMAIYQLSNEEKRDYPDWEHA